MTDRPPSATDVLIVGAGIAGASLAAALAPWRRVVLAEAENAPGYHATGRSAAFWHETYGGARVQPLTLASLTSCRRSLRSRSRLALVSSVGSGSRCDR